MKHYNIFALRGDTMTTDQDVCDTMGLDPRLAGSPEINEAAIKKMHRENYDGYVARGMDPETALSEADKQANKARAEIKSLMKQ
jgi:hypothetical protein